MENIFVQLAIILGLASLLGLGVYSLKLPLVIAYLLVGVLLSLFPLFHTHSSLVFSFLPNLGIAFVLFLIGMELDLRELKALGKPIILTSLTQIIISALAGFAIMHTFGFSVPESLLLGVGLSFSSTVVIIKLLLEKRDLASLYGKLSVGILLIEDLAAVAVLMAISVSSSPFHLGLQESWPFLALIFKAGGLFLLTFLLSRFVLEKFFDAVAKSSELLFLTAIAWCFLFTALAQLAGFSVTIGAFLAGIALASSPYHYQIQGKIKPLRDFFVTLFFVYLGTQVNIADIPHVWTIVLFFTLYALIVKPLLFFLLLGAFGFRKHTLFQAGINLTQISEFSLVIALLGVQMQILPVESLSIMATVAVVSVMLSSIMISYSKKIYKKISPYLVFFEHQMSVHIIEEKVETSLIDHVVIIGAHRVGGPIVAYLKKTDIPFVVMDFNPNLIEQLRKQHINVIYGDIGDPDTLDSLHLEKAKLIISTATELADNELLLVEVKRRGLRVPVVARAVEQSQVKELRSLGADYVILPEQVSGDFLVSQLKSTWPEVKFEGMGNIG